MLAAGFGEVWASAATTADDRCQRLDHRAGLHPGSEVGGDRHDHLHLAVLFGGDDHYATADARLERVGEAAQRILVEIGHLAAGELHATDVHRFVGLARSAAAHGQLRLQLRHLACQLLRLGLQFLDRVYRQVGVRVQHIDDPLQRRALLLHVGQRVEAGDPFDAAHAGSDTTLGEDLERADVARRRHVRAATEFDAEAGDGDDADLVAVLLTEERHRARRNRLLSGTHVGGNQRVLHDLLVDDSLDAQELVGRDRLEMLEVEAQAVRRDERAGLLHVRAEHLAQGRMQQVGSRVVAPRGVAYVGIHLRIDDVANAQGALLDADAVCTRQPGLDTDKPLDRRRRTGGLVGDPARVGHLTARFQIERRPCERDES